MKKALQNDVSDLCDAFLSLESGDEVMMFLRDLCTPQEINALQERWRVCQLLDRGLSYRDIHRTTGASLTTVGRVARFLRNEPYQGSRSVLDKVKGETIV